MKKKMDPMRLVKKVADKLTKKAKASNFPEFKVGDTVRVYVRVKEGEKTRAQPFEGVVIKKRRGGERASFTVRKIASGVGVERIFPFHSPAVDRIMLVSKGEVRRSRLYYLRGLRGRKGRIKSTYVYEDTVTGSGTGEGSSSGDDSSDSKDATKKKSDSTEDVSVKAARG